jgi:hypothetical protein
MKKLPERIRAWPWNRKDFAGQWHVHGQGETIGYVREDIVDAQDAAWAERVAALEAAVAAARAEGWAMAIEAVKVEVKEWLDLPAVPPKNPRAEIYDDACTNIMRFVCDLKPPTEASK